MIPVPSHMPGLPMQTHAKRAFHQGCQSGWHSIITEAQRHATFMPSCFLLPWCGTTQSHFPPAPHQVAWHMAMTNVASPPCRRIQQHCTGSFLVKADRAKVETPRVGCQNGLPSVWIGALIECVVLREVHLYSKNCCELWLAGSSQGWLVEGGRSVA